MESEPARIAARSRLEAMDWSLVLISQGIESTVQPCQEGTGWELEISRHEYDRAQEVIRLYRKENRGWGLRREILQPGLVFDWVSLVWVVLVSALFWLNTSHVDLESPGVLDTVALAHGQWWRLFTAMWLHADLGHLASNAVFGVVLLGLTMGRYGTGAGLLAAYLAGAGGNLMSWLFSARPHLGLGASGMVMGCLGLLAVQSVSLWRRTSRAGREFLGGLLAGVMLFVLLGLTPGTDVVAHFGGFVSGLLLGGLLAGWIQQVRKPVINLAGALGFTALVLVPWWLALQHAGPPR
jgi:membrane associated rhomboid family serine protease